MNRLIQLIALAGILLASVSAENFAEAAPLNTTARVTVNNSDEHIVWQRAPIKITLPVGKERLVTFPGDVQFGYDVRLLPASTLRVENDNQTLYLLAKQPFDTQRTEVKLGNGTVILLDIKARKNAAQNPIDIVLPKKTNNSSVPSRGQEGSQDSVNAVSLTRYAIQQLYAPRRLLKQSMTVTRFPMETEHVVPLFYDGSASAMPLASWRAGDLYVTALLIKNLLAQPLSLDPRVLCGDWKAASFYPQTLLAAHGTPMNRDTSTLFLVSNQPFSEAIANCLPIA